MNDLKSIAERIYKEAPAALISASIRVSHSNNIRIARNSVSTCGTESNQELIITVYDENRLGVASTNDFSPEGIREVVIRAQAIAQTKPSDPEYMPPLLPPLKYLEVAAFDQEMSLADPGKFSEDLNEVLKIARQHKLISAAYLVWGSYQRAYSTSQGLWASHQETFARFSITSRSEDGTRSGKATFEGKCFPKRRIPELAEEAAAYAVGGAGFPSSLEVRELPPGDYPTILSPHAVADMLFFLFTFMNRRAADEGRSVFSESGGKVKIGKSLFDNSINLYSDPQDPLAPACPFTADGFPHLKTSWIANGILRNLITDRFWAKKNKLEPLASPSNLIMSGTNQALEDLIQGTDRAIYVVRFWYIRVVDPQEALLTGLTRDGVFLIEDGKIVARLKNFRFNESPLNVLRHTIARSQTVRALGNEMEEIAIAAPGIIVSTFHFSSISDAV